MGLKGLLMSLYLGRRSPADERSRALRSVSLRSFRSLGLLRRFLLDHRLGRGQPGNWHAEGRGADVVHSHLVAEFHAGGVATVLAADPDLELRPCRPAAVDGPFDEHTHTGGVDGLKR